MRKTREEKAITLIALIITIVVLLILAVVAINAVTGEGIIQHAVNAKTSYEDAQAKENGILAYYEQYLTTQSGSGPWKQDGDNLYMTDSEGKRINLKIGDKVEYDEGYDAENLKTTTIDSNFLMKDLDWRVLGVNSKGQLELISTEATNSTVTIGGEDGYLNGPEKLNKICSDLYSTSIASARSLNVDDINRIAGITEEDKESYGREYGYGTWWQYKFDETLGKIVYRNSEDAEVWTNWTPTVYQSSGDLVFKEPGKNQLDSSNPNKIAEVKCTKYKYSISEEIPSTKVSYDNKLISSLISGTDVRNEANELIAQWLASTFTWCLNGGVQWEICGIGNGIVSSVTVKTSLHTAAPNGLSKSYRVRPVVTLNSNVALTKGNVDGEWKIESVNK